MAKQASIVNSHTARLDFLSWGKLPRYACIAHAAKPPAARFLPMYICTCRYEENDQDEHAGNDDSRVGPQLR